MSINISYYNKYKKIKSSGSYKQLTWRGKRKDLTEKYSWAIPNNLSIRFLADESNIEPIIEIGAGNGYWAHKVQEQGGEIIPIDIKRYDNTWTDVIIASYDSLNESRVNRILLCWPPANSSMAIDSVKHLKPTYIYFVGVKNSSITGNIDFYNYIDTQFREVKTINIPSWSNNNVKLTKYKKIP